MKRSKVEWCVAKKRTFGRMQGWRVCVEVVVWLYSMNAWHWFGAVVRVVCVARAAPKFSWDVSVVGCGDGHLGR